MALRDRDGLPGASSLPYFFLLELAAGGERVPFDDEDSEFSSLLTDALKVLLRLLFDEDDVEDEVTVFDWFVELLVLRLVEEDDVDDE